MRHYNTSSIHFPRLTGAVLGLTIANIAVFVVQQLAGDTVITLFGLIPRLVITKLWVWQVLSYAFLHANIFHILINLFTLWMFGTAVEQYWGTRKFLGYYLLCATGAGVLTIITSPLSVIPSIGASGAVYGLLAAYAFLFPDNLIYFYFFFPVKAKYFVWIIGALTFFSSIKPNTDGIAYYAHLGGLLTGYLYLKLSTGQWPGYRVYARPFEGRVFDVPVWNTIKTIITRAYYSVVTTLDRVIPRRKVAYPFRSNKSSEQQINAILDKIIRHGAGSLTKEEREIMKRYTKDKPKGTA
ncbi:MAG: rhomboid family intramembrane serine protease [Elusimicrobiota bacterium]